VQLYSLESHYLGEGVLHHREKGEKPPADAAPAKPGHNYLDLLIDTHEEQLAAQSRGIDYRKAPLRRPWPFTEFVKALARLMGKKGGLADFTMGELETLKKLYNRDAALDQQRLQRAFARAELKTIPYIAYELRQTKPEDQ